jgi:hypothetical protein
MTKQPEKMIPSFTGRVPRLPSRTISSLVLIAGIAMSESGSATRVSVSLQKESTATPEAAADVSTLTVRYFPVYVQSPGEWVGFAVTNQGDVPAALTLTAYGPSGELLPLPANPFRTSLGPHQQMAELGTQLFGSAADSIDGWVAVESDQPGISGMFQLGTDDLHNLDGGAAIEHGNPELFFTRIYEGKGSFYGKDATTYVSIVNLDSAEATVALSVGSHPATVTLPPRGSLYKSISELFGPITVTGDVLRARNLVPPEDAGNPGSFSIIGCSITKTESAYLTLDAQPVNMYAATLYAPQIAVGGSYFTSLKIVNGLSVEKAVSLTAKLESGQELHAQRIVLPPKGVIEDDLASMLAVTPSASPVSGSLTLEMETPGVFGDVVFGDASTRRFAAAVPLERNPGTDGIFNQVASGAGYFTGVALQNSLQLPLTATLEVFDQDGVSQGLSNIELPGMQRLSDLISELLPQTSGLVNGYVRIKSDKPVIAQQLFGTDNLEALSAVPLAAAAPSTPLDLADRQILTVEEYNAEAPFIQIHQFKQVAGDGSFQHTWQSAADPAWRSDTTMAVGDLDADGLDEIVMMNMYDNRVRVYRQGSLGAPSIDTQLWEPGREWTSLIDIGDLTGDGRGELAISKSYWAEVWQMQQGSLQRIWSGKPASDYLWAPVIGDANNDGRNELLFPNGKAGLLVYDTQGSSATWTGKQVALPPEVAGSASGLSLVKLADLDPALQNGNEVIGTGNFGRVIIWKYAKESDTYRTTYVSDQLPDSAWALATGDIDGDGTQEIMVGTTNMDTMFIYKNSGAGWHQQSSFSVSGCTIGLDSIHAGDVDGDGKAEIVYAPLSPLGRSDTNCHGLWVYGLNLQGEVYIKYRLPQGAYSGFYVGK